MSGADPGRRSSAAFLIGEKNKATLSKQSVGFSYSAQSTASLRWGRGGILAPPYAELCEAALG